MKHRLTSKMLQIITNIFKKFIEITVLLNEFYTRNSGIEYIEHDCIVNFIENYLDFDEIYNQIEFVQTKNFSWTKKTKRISSNS